MMYVAKAPLRVSFFGGGSDLPAYYLGGGPGLCLSTTIDRYVYVAVKRCQADHIKLTYSNFELTNNLDSVEHSIVRETLRYFNIKNNIEISSFSDIPHAGTGLGSSSSFTVALVHALCKMQNKKITDRDLAEIACEIEIDRCKQPIGKQDQYAAAFGGMNLYTFKPNHTVEIKFLTQPFFVDNLLFYNTGMQREAAKILSQQSISMTYKNDREKIDSMVEMTKRAKVFVEENKGNEFGAMLDEAWKIKRSLHNSISNSVIDEMYETAMEAGALGGKVLGAGGGGYLMVYVPDDKFGDVTRAMHRWPLNIFKVSEEGSKVHVI